MKLHTTQKAIRAAYPHVIRVSYCAAQHLLTYQAPFAYNAGVYGWNCDYYNINGIIICTGYRPHGNNVDYNIVNKWDKKAESVYNTVRDYDDRRNIINDYLKEFLQEVTQ